MKKTRVSHKSIFGEYVSHWYILLLTIILIIPGYMILPLVNSFMATRGFNAVVSGLVGIIAGGFVSTFPLLILNIILTFRGKAYALAVQFVLFDVLGTAFYLINQVGLSS